MKLEEQVAPLELARQMKEAGFPQATLFVWSERGLDVSPINPTRPGYFHGSPAHDLDVDDYCSEHMVDCAAPTVAEMGEWLPEELGPLGAQLEITRMGSEWLATYREESAAIEHQSKGATEAEARARLLIALAESGAIDPRKLSSR